MELSNKSVFDEEIHGFSLEVSKPIGQLAFREIVNLAITEATENNLYQEQAVMFGSETATELAQGRA